MGTGTLEISGPSESATISVVFLAQAGFNVVTLAGALNLTEDGYLHNATLDTPAVGDQVLTNAVLLANGDIGENQPGVYDNYHFDVSDAQISLEYFTLTIGEGGASSNVIKTEFRRFPWQAHNKL